MSITLVSDVDRPLTVEEFDANFTTLKAMIDYVTSHPVAGVSVSSITQAGSAGPLTFHMSDGSTRGPFSLPTASFRFRGDWAALTTYVSGDFFSVEDVGLYVVLKSHTSGAEFDPDLQVTGSDAVALAVPFTNIRFGDAITESMDIDANFANTYVDVTPDGSPPVELTVQLAGDSDTPAWHRGDTFTVEDIDGVNVEFIEGDGVVINVPGGLQPKTRSTHSQMTLLYKGDGIFVLSGDLLLV